MLGNAAVVGAADMGRAGGGEFGEEVGDGVDVGKLHYGCGLALADLDANVWRLVQGAETVLIGDVIAQEDHCGGSDALVPLVAWVAENSTTDLPAVRGKPPGSSARPAS